MILQQNVKAGDCIRSAPETPIGVSSNKIREIRIVELNYGYVVNVGCHAFAVETKERLCRALNDYIMNPAETEANWFKTKKI